MVERFQSKIHRTPGCWLWQGATYPSGYGAFYTGPRDAAAPMTGAHRVAWQLAHGPIPEGQYVLHRCGVKRCVRPDHLYLGDQADNMADARRHGFSTAGVRNGSAKLTPTEVAEIRRLYRAGGTLQRELAERFGVAQTLISQITRGLIWREVQV